MVSKKTNSKKGGATHNGLIITDGDNYFYNGKIIDNYQEYQKDVEESYTENLLGTRVKPETKKEI